MRIKLRLNTTHPLLAQQPRPLAEVLQLAHLEDSLMVTDDGSNSIWRVSYAAK